AVNMLRLLLGLHFKDAIPAPSLEQFANTLNRFRHNQTVAASKSTFAKRATLSVCLYEAHNDMERKFLARAVCMRVVQDASPQGALLLTRHIACGLGRERACGILQVVDGTKK
ncbi:MAG: hypothetical protein ACKPKO_32615, partial [Candidatus Fonsibacter sp.]